jgi:hypothetical protein
LFDRDTNRGRLIVGGFNRTGEFTRRLHRQAA